MTMIRSVDNLVDFVLARKYRAVFIEGCTCSGKSYLTDILIRQLSNCGWYSYKAWKDLRYDQGLLEHYDISLGQSTLDVCDVLRCCPELHLVVDRSPLSAAAKACMDFSVRLPTVTAPDLAHNRVDLFVELLADIPAHVIYLDIPWVEIHERIRNRAEAGGRLVKMSYVTEEREQLDKFMCDLPPSMVTTIKEPLS